MSMKPQHYLWTLLLLLLTVSLHISPTAAQPCPHDGDVNQDGICTPADALECFRHFLRIADPPLDECQQDRADVRDPMDPGSEITPADCLCIFKKFLGLPSCLVDSPDTCRAHFFAQNIVAADTCFQALLAADPTNQEAHLFRASTRLMRIAEENRDGSDPTTHTDSFKEMLDQFGITSEGRSLFDFFAKLPEDTLGKLDLPLDSPTGEDIQTFLRNVLLPEVTNAIEENLSALDDAFSLMISREELDRFGFSDEGPVEIDFGDVKIIEAVLRTFKGSLLSTLLAYNMNLNIGELNLDIVIDEPQLDDVQIQSEILDPHPDFLTPKGDDSANLLAEAKESVKAGLEAYFVASHFIRTRDDAKQSDDAITIEPEDLADEEELRRLLGETRCSLDGATFQALTDTGVLCEATGVPTIDDEPVNLSRFFDTPFNLREALPPFTFDAACGGNFIDTTMPTATFPFPDPTFNGILPGKTQVALLDYLDLAPDMRAFVSTKNISGGTGLATHPATGELWALLQVTFGREVATIDPATGFTTSVGNIDERFAGLAFDAAGTLYGVTGSGDDIPETLFTLNTSDVQSALLLPLGRGGRGEAIGFNPVDGHLYHMSGSSDRIFESIDLDQLTTTDIPLSGNTFSSPMALTYWEAEEVFLLADQSNQLFRLTPSGEETLIGSLDHQSKGLAFSTSTPPILYSLSRFGAQLHVINPTDASSISRITLSSTAEQTVRVSFSNNGNDLVPPLTIESLTLTDGTVFHLAPILSDSDFPIVLCEEDDRLVVDIVFTPPTDGQFTDTLIIQSNDLNKPRLNLPISGCAGEPTACE